MVVLVSIGGWLSLVHSTLVRCAVINSMYLRPGLMQSFAALRARVLTLGSPKNFALFAENSLSHVWGAVTSLVAPVNVDESTEKMEKTFSANSAENLFTCQSEDRILPNFAAKIVQMLGREEINSNTPVRLVENNSGSRPLTRNMGMSDIVRRIVTTKVMQGVPGL